MAFFRRVHFDKGWQTLPVHVQGIDRICSVGVKNSGWVTRCQYGWLVVLCFMVHFVVAITSHLVAGAI